MSDVDKIDELVKKYNQLKKEISKVIVGQEAVVDQILISVFSGGHALLVGVPGLAKTWSRRFQKLWGWTLKEFNLRQI